MGSGPLGNPSTAAPAFLLPFFPPGVELLPYSFSSLKWPADPKLLTIQELFLPPSLNTSVCSLIVLCTSVQFNLSVMSTLCYIMGCSMPGFLVHHKLPELARTHVHQVGHATQQFHLLSSPLSPAFNLFTIRVFYNELVLPINWPK